jgi:hypothetical protein
MDTQGVEGESSTPWVFVVLREAENGSEASEEEQSILNAYAILGGITNQPQGWLGAVRIRHHEQGEGR